MQLGPSLQAFFRRLTKKHRKSNLDGSSSASENTTTKKRIGQSSLLVNTPEVLSEVLFFLDRFTIDTVEISCRLFYDTVGKEAERLAWRHVQRAGTVFIKPSYVLTLRAVLPTAGPSIGYRQRRSTLRTIVKRFEAHETPELLEFFLSALFYSHVDHLGLSGFLVLDCVATLISQYAPAVSVKHFYCAYLTLAADPSELDHAKFYAAFDKFASIQSLTCSSSCANEIANQLRNLCTAKQIRFTTL